jgi:hypothetical protein
MTFAPNIAEASCTGKDSYTSSRARRIADDMRKRGRKSVQPYHCVHCGQWHVGSRVSAMPDKRRDEKQGKRFNEEEAS